MSKLEAGKGTVLDTELRERRERVEQLRLARRLAGVGRWDRAWIRWSWRLAVVVALLVLSFELGRELLSCSR
jgi:hypothetical protein